MPTSDTLDLTAAADALRDLCTRALENESADDFELIERRVSEFDAAARELQQAMWKDEAKATIRRLERHQPLTDADQTVLRTFLVSDAERYVALENNYRDWGQELQRLMDEITRRLASLDRESIADLRGTLKDAIRLVPDIRNYLDERRRVKLFDAGLQNLDPPTRATLARLLRDQLYSSNL